MTVWLESPWYLLCIGGVVLLAFAAGWFQTGERRLLYGVALGLLIAVGGLALERAVETDREALARAIHGMARDVQNNDVDAVIEHILFTEDDIKQYVRNRMSEYHFTRVDIKPNLDLALDMQRVPPKAIATFNVVVEVENLRRPQPMFVVLTLAEHEGRWRVRDVDVRAPHERVAAEERLQ